MISAINNSYNTPYKSRVNFAKNKTVNKSSDENPISRKGETMNLILTTFVGGIAVAGKLLVSIFEDGQWLPDMLGDISDVISTKKKSKDEKKAQEKFDEIFKKYKSKKEEINNKNVLKAIGIFVSLIAVGFCGFALLYTIFNAPKIAYNSKINTYKKRQEMDVYIKGNQAEKELYTQLDEQAKKVHTKEEKDVLKSEYLQLKNAKNLPPEFVKINSKQANNKQK